MKNKDMLLKALRYEETPRAPWVPYVGVHAASLIGRPADEFLRSADLIHAGVMKAVNEYQPDGIPLLFDLQLEAEALGCGLTWARDNPPAVTGHILDQVPVGEMPALPSDGGRIPAVMEATARLVGDLGPDVAPMGLVCGPFTLGLHLMGSRIITAMIKKSEEVHAVMGYCARICRDMTRLYLDQGIDIVAIVDPMTSQISPQFFDRFVAPSYQPALDAIHERPARYSLIFVCGNATRIIPNLAAIEATGFAVDENLDFAYVAAEARKRRRAFAGNLPLTVGLLFGEEEENVQYAKDCIDAGWGPGFILAPGCDMPYDTDVANVKAVMRIAHDYRPR